MTAPEGGQAPTQVLAPLGPAVADRVASWLGMTGGPDQDVVDTTEAVNVMVRRWKRSEVPEDGKPWPADRVRGAVMLAGRMYRRKDSPAGLLPFGGDGGASYIAKTDPDVAMLLEIGPYASPEGVG